MTPEEAAQGLYGLLPRALTPPLLAEYGISATEDQAHALTRELLALNLYWIRAAVTAHIRSTYRTLIFDRLLDLIEREWETAFSQAPGSWAAYQNELSHRFAAYQPIGAGPGGHFAVASEVCAMAEDRRLIELDDRSKLLALLIELVPLDGYGDLLDRE